MDKYDFIIIGVVVTVSSKAQNIHIEVGSMELIFNKIYSMFTTPPFEKLVFNPFLWN